MISHDFFFDGTDYYSLIRESNMISSFIYVAGNGRTDQRKR